MAKDDQDRIDPRAYAQLERLLHRAAEMRFSNGDHFEVKELGENLAVITATERGQSAIETYARAALDCGTSPEMSAQQVFAINAMIRAADELLKTVARFMADSEILGDRDLKPFRVIAEEYCVAALVGMSRVNWECAGSEEAEQTLRKISRDAGYSYGHEIGVSVRDGMKQKEAEPTAQKCRT